MEQEEATTSGTTKKPPRATRRECGPQVSVEAIDFGVQGVVWGGNKKLIRLVTIGNHAELKRQTMNPTAAVSKTMALESLNNNNDTTGTVLQCKRKNANSSSVDDATKEQCKRSKRDDLVQTAAADATLPNATEEELAIAQAAQKPGMLLAIIQQEVLALVADDDLF